MKNITAALASLFVFLPALSAFACGPSWDSPGEIGILSILISVVPLTFYSIVSALYLFFMRRQHSFGFKHNAWIWFKASALSYLVSMTAMFTVAIVNNSFSLPSNLMFTFVATAPLVALAGYFTRVYYTTKREIV